MVTEPQYTYNGWIEAFQIFSKYADDDNWIEISVEHDQVFTGPAPTIIEIEDRKRLSDLGWVADNDLGCFWRFV